MKTAVIVQARTGSSRLPAKVLMDILGKPMLWHVINRISLAGAVDETILATPENDRQLEEFAAEYGLKHYAGSEDDVLDRYYRAALAFKCDNIVRITSDCPLIDPGIIDAVIGEFLRRRTDVDYMSNTLVNTYPRGLDVEIMSFAALQRAWEEDGNPAWREHVTQYIIRNPGKFKLQNLPNDEDYSQLRWTVDTEADLELVRRIYEHFQRYDFGWREVMAAVEAHPEWLEINRHIRQKEIP